MLNEVIFFFIELVVVMVDFQLVLVFPVGTDCHIFNGPVLAQAISDHNKCNSCADDKNSYQETIKEVVWLLYDSVLNFDSKFSNVRRRR